MRTIEIWPKEVEAGDAVDEGFTATYLRLVDPETDTEVLVMLRAEALQQLAAAIGAGVRGQRNPHGRRKGNHAHGRTFPGAAASRMIAPPSSETCPCPSSTPPKPLFRSSAAPSC